MAINVIYKTDPANIATITSNALEPLFDAIGLSPKWVRRIIIDAQFGGIFDLEVAGFVYDNDMELNAEHDPIAFRAEYRIDWSEVAAPQPPEPA